MRVFNLTDLPTETLTNRGLLLQHIAVAGRMVAPGEYVDVESSAKVTSDLEFLVTVGAVAIDTLPPPYVMARQQAEARSGNLAAHIGQRVSLKETKVAGEAVPTAPAEGTTVTAEKHDPTTEASDEPPAPEPVPAPAPAPAPKHESKKKHGNR